MSLRVTSALIWKRVSSQLKAFAQGALSAYLKSIFLAPDKDMFDVSTVDSSELALSMGLASVPRLRFLPRGTSLPSKATGDAG